MATRVRILTIVAALSCLTIPALATEANWKLVVRLQGTVQSSVDAMSTWQPIYTQRLLSNDDAARTLAESRARIQTADGSVALMAPNTVAVLKEYDLERGTLKIQVDSGGVRAKVGTFFQGRRFEVNTRHGVLAAQGTDFAVIYRDQRADRTPPMLAGTPAPGLGQATEEGILAWVFEGQVMITTNTGQTAVLYAGDAASIDGSGNLVLNPPDITPDSFPPCLRPAPDERRAPPTRGTYGSVQAPGGTGAMTRFQGILPFNASHPGTPSPGLPITNPNQGTVEVHVKF